MGTSMDECPSGTLMWFGGYEVVLPKRTDVSPACFTVLSGAVTMFPDGNIVFYGGKRALLYHRKNVRMIRLRGVAEGDNSIFLDNPDTEGDDHGIKDERT